jgi:hypothetical protein
VQQDAVFEWVAAELQARLRSQLEARADETRMFIRELNLGSPLRMIAHAPLL